MAREYARLHELYLQPPANHYACPYELQPQADGAHVYELTAGAAHALGCPEPQQPPPPHEPRKRKSSRMRGDCAETSGEGVVLAELPQRQYVCQSSQPSQPPQPSQSSQDLRMRSMIQCSDGCDAASCEALSASSASTAAAGRKRKTSPFSASSAYDDDGQDDARSHRSAPDKRQNHSEIEKRRRDKMNTYISELSAMVPMCGAMARKLDKLTVLRMAVQHLRSVRGALSAGPLTRCPRPAFLSEQELNALVLHAAEDSFLMVVGCDRGRLLYVSASVIKLLQYDQEELLGQSLFDILHPKDVAKVKEQLAASELGPRERLIDAKTMLPVKADVVTGASRLCPGARRSFFCRIKCRASPEASAAAASTSTSNSTQVNQVKEETEPSAESSGKPSAKPRKKQTNEKKYCVVQCTGYLKSWAPAEMCDAAGGADALADDGDACNLSCLVAVGRALADLIPRSPAPHARFLQYVSRHATDGKFLFVDQRVTLALGFLPQELLGTSLYEHVGALELGALARTHKAALLRREPLKTPPYCFRRKDGTYTRIQTHFKPFKNPWTKDVECLVANNTVLTDEWPQPTLADCSDHYDIYDQSQPFCDDLDGRLSEADVEMQRLIDSQIESHKIGSTIAEEALRRPSAELSPELPADLLQDAAFGPRSSLVDDMLGSDAVDYGERVQPEAQTDEPPPASPPLGLDGNGEAAMAVIMSLFEADAGLGGPVSFAGLPWPLP